MDISQADSNSGTAPQSNIPQASVVIRPTDEAGQSVDGMLPMTPLVPPSAPPASVVSTPPLAPPEPTPAPQLAQTPQPVPATTPSPATTPQALSPSAPPQTPTPPRTIDAIHIAPPVPGGTTPNRIAIDKVFQTPEDAKAQMVSQVPPVSEPVPAPAASLTPKKGTRPSLPVLLGLIAGGLILLAGVAFLTISMLSKKSANTTTNTSTIVQPVVMNSSDIIGMITKTVPGSSSLQNTSGPSYQVAKAAYGVVVLADAAVSYPAADAAAATTVYNKILPVLTSNGVKARTTAAGTTKSTSTGFDATGTHCQVSTVLKTVVVACSNTKTYEDTTTKLAPVYAAFTTARPVDKAKQPQTLAVTRWATSKTAGYTIADISVTDVTVAAIPVDHLFYQMPDKSWHYVGEALSTTGCGNFNTADLKKAFLGEPCMNGTTKAAVVLQ